MFHTVRVKSAKHMRQENHTSKRRNVKMQFKLHPKNGTTIDLYVHRMSTSMVLYGSTILICVRMSRIFNFWRSPPDNSSTVYTCVRGTYSTITGVWQKNQFYGAPNLDIEYWPYIGVTLLIPI
jgi:hypothetical protein